MPLVLKERIIHPLIISTLDPANLANFRPVAFGGGLDGPRHLLEGGVHGPPLPSMTLIFWAQPQPPLEESFEGSKVAWLTFFPSFPRLKSPPPQQATRGQPGGIQFLAGWLAAKS